MNTKLFCSAMLLGALTLTGCKAKGEATITANPDGDATAEPAPEPEAAPQEEDPSDVHIVGDHLEIDQKIQFAHDSDEILPESSEILDHLALTLRHHGEFKKVHVVGHTDKTGDADHNQDLSERRAASVKAALEQREVPQAIETRGAGSNEPLCTEDTDECHEKNRRVEFIVETEDFERADKMVE